MALRRCLDFIVAAIGLILIAPLLAAVGLTVWLTMGSPVLFRQARLGRNGQIFSILKFRTMADERGSNGELLPDAARLTRLGRLLRGTSLDELPELWNVLKGDMSLVGPRPLLVKYMPFFTEEEMIRFTVRPGITGWAQVNGRNEASWDDRFRMDIWYVQNQSFVLDMKILWMTIGKVLRREQVIVDARSAMLNLDEERAQRKATGR